MQIKYLPQSLYKSYNNVFVVTAKSEQVQKRKKFLGNWEILKARKVPDKEIAKITGISRATFYRLKKLLNLYGLNGLEKQSTRPKVFRQSKISQETRQAILNIRTQNSTYGKDKIAIILKRDFKITLSASSIGRLIKKFKTSGLITPSRSRLKKVRKRTFKGYAKPWQYGTKIVEPGQLVQISHDSNKKSNTFKTLPSLGSIYQNFSSRCI